MTTSSHDIAASTTSSRKRRQPRRIALAASGIALALGLSLAVANPASAAPAGSPNCSNRSQVQIVYLGTTQINWKYNNDYHWNGRYYVWSYRGDSIVWHGPTIGWQTGYTNMHYQCP